MSDGISISIDRETAKGLVLIAGILILASGVAAILEIFAAPWPFPYGLFATLGIFIGWVGGVVLLWDLAKRRLGV